MGDGGGAGEPGKGAGVGVRGREWTGAAKRESDGLKTEGVAGGESRSGWEAGGRGVQGRMKHAEGEEEFDSLRQTHCPAEQHSPFQTFGGHTPPSLPLRPLLWTSNLPEGEDSLLSERTSISLRSPYPPRLRETASELPFSPRRVLGPSSDSTLGVENSGLT